MPRTLTGASIWSENHTALVPFYRDTLGLQPSIEQEGFVVFGDEAAPGLLLGTHSEVRGKNPDPARHMVGLSSDDVRTDYDRLKAAGVEFVESPTDYGGAIIATLKDPEGNLIQLFQRS